MRTEVKYTHENTAQFFWAFLMVDIWIYYKLRQYLIIIYLSLIPMVKYGKMI